MALFDSMLKPGWQHPDKDVRKTAVEELDDESVLASIIESDPELEIRKAALAKISDPVVLDTLLSRIDGPVLNLARAQRLSQLLPEKSRVTDIKDDDTLLHVAALTDSDPLRLEAIGLLSSPSVRYDVAREHAVAKVRLSAAQGIEDIETLQRLMDATQGKDKAIYRYCKDQLNRHKAALKSAADRQNNIELLIEKARALSSALDSPEYAGSVRLLQRTWDEVSEHASKEQLDAIRLHLETCAARVADKEAVAKAEAERGDAEASAAETIVEVVSQLSGLADNFPALESRKEVVGLSKVLEEAESRWKEAAHHVRSNQEQTRQYQDLLGNWRRMESAASTLREKTGKLRKLGADLEKADKSDYNSLEQLQQRADALATSIKWPAKSSVARPAGLSDLNSWIGQIGDRLNAMSADAEKNNQRVEEGLQSLGAAVSEGHMKDASRALSRTRRALKSLPVNRQKRHDKVLRDLVAKFDEIRDWQGFAIEPKKLELCEAMEALVGSKVSAEKLAGQIHELQENWKQLGPISPHRDQELWVRFSKTADKAYEPCKEAFARQADERKANLALRMEVIAELRAYEKQTEWPDEETSEFDWKSVLAKLDETRSKMRAIKPVGQKGASRSEGALKKAADKVYDHLRQEYDRNIQRKEELIERAQKLAELESLDQAIEQAKRLQVLWKGVGVTPVKVDRGQWKKFRTACDAVFKRLDAEKKQHRAEIDAVVSHAEGLVKQAEDLLHASDDADRVHIGDSLKEIQKNISELDLPKGAEQRLGKRLAQVERKAKQVADETRARLREQRWQFVATRIRACAMRPTDVEEATAAWDQDGETPRGVDGKALEAWWNDGCVDNNSDKLREICIALEVLADIDSPAADKQARMAYQVQRLAEGMGKQREAPRTTLIKLINDFIALRPTSEWANRFCDAVGQVKLV